jgi:hypothetical protein
MTASGGSEPRRGIVGCGRSMRACATEGAMSRFDIHLYNDEEDVDHVLDVARGTRGTLT